ncbi:MAG: hypothetical protein ACYC0F_07270 [Rhodanobacter sp.]
MTASQKSVHHDSSSTVPPVFAAGHAKTPPPLEWQRHLPDPPAPLPEPPSDDVPAMPSAGHAPARPDDAKDK